MVRLEVRLIAEDLEIGYGVGIQKHTATLCEGREEFGSLEDRLQLKGSQVIEQAGQGNSDNARMSVLPRLLQRRPVLHHSLRER